MDTWQLRMGFLEEHEAAVAASVPVDLLSENTRKLALHVYLQAVIDAREGDIEAWLWLGTEGRELMRDLGQEGLASLDVATLLSSVNIGQLKEALGEETRHCRSCSHLEASKGRCSCSKGMWAEQGRRESYASATVVHDSKGFLEPCELWEGRDK